MVNLFAEVDVSVVCEEVVEGVFAGYVFQNMTAGNFDIVPAPRDKMKGQDTKAIATLPAQSSEADQSHVQVIFDVDMHSYNFVTQPGAFRRVIMNLLGNALKYTSHGYVFLNLIVAPMSPLSKPATGEIVARSLVTITIKDTGRGISAEFLRSKVFTPFAQENSLSSGTGLGLSIVRSIISLLEGEITIDSEVRKGTGESLCHCDSSRLILFRNPGHATTTS
jgi:signal transduction histidine kinase